MPGTFRLIGPTIGKYGSVVQIRKYHRIDRQSTLAFMIEQKHSGRELLEIDLVANQGDIGIT
jgi:hypothetical protein